MSIGVAVCDSSYSFFLGGAGFPASALLQAKSHGEAARKHKPEQPVLLKWESLLKARCIHFACKI